MSDKIISDRKVTAVMSFLLLEICYIQNVRCEVLNVRTFTYMSLVKLSGHHSPVRIDHISETHILNDLDTELKGTSANAFINAYHLYYNGGGGGGDTQ